MNNHELRRRFDRYARTRRQALRDPVHMLIEAIHTDNLLDVVLVIGHHPKAVHWFDRTGCTALRAAIEDERLDIANFLLASGAHLHQPDNVGVTPWARAQEKGWYIHEGTSLRQASRPTNADPAPAPVNAQNGVFSVDAEGFLKAADGRRIACFGDQKEAAHWILKIGQRQSLSQHFDIALHPSRPGFAAVDRTAGPIAAASPGRS